MTPVWRGLLSCSESRAHRQPYCHLPFIHRKDAVSRASLHSSRRHSRDRNKFVAACTCGAAGGLAQCICGCTSSSSGTVPESTAESKPSCTRAPIALLPRVNGGVVPAQAPALPCLPFSYAGREASSTGVRVMASRSTKQRDEPHTAASVGGRPNAHATSSSIDRSEADTPTVTDTPHGRGDRECGPHCTTTIKWTSEPVVGTPARHADRASRATYSRSRAANSGAVRCAADGAVACP